VTHLLHPSLKILKGAFDLLQCGVNLFFLGSAELNLEVFAFDCDLEVDFVGGSLESSNDIFFGVLVEDPYE
jgi:hypothetical protein